MKLFNPGQSKRLNEVTGFLFLATGILFLLSMASFQPRDPSWDTVAGNIHTNNLIGPVGAHIADVFLQSFGLAAFLFPLLIFGLGGVIVPFIGIKLIDVVINALKLV